MSKTLSDLERKLAELEETHSKKKDQIRARIKDAKARQKQAVRKRDTRRKIIAGSLSLHHADKNRSSDYAKTNTRLLNEYVISDKDRELFDLPPLPQDEQDARKERHKRERKKQTDMETID